MNSLEISLLIKQNVKRSPLSVYCTLVSTCWSLGMLTNLLFFFFSGATILTSQRKVSVKQGVPVKIDVQYRGGVLQGATWRKDGQALPSGWTQNAVPGVISISKQSPVYSDIGTYTLNVSTPSFSNPLYQSTTASTTLDVLGKCRLYLLDCHWHFAATFCSWLFVVLLVIHFEPE